MAELKSVPLTSKKERSKSQKKEQHHEERTCVVHNINFKGHDEIKPLTERRWDTIQKSKTQRFLAETDSDRLSPICERIPTEFDSARHGFHDYCYNTFINLRSLRKKHSSGDSDKSAQEESCSSRKKAKQSFSTRLLPIQCLFCEKTTKWTHDSKGTKKVCKLVKCVTRTAEASIKEAVNRKSDSKLRGQVENVDLIAQEAWYHEPCRKVYTRKEDRHSQASTSKHCSEEEKAEAEERKKAQAAEEEAHSKAFQHVCQYVEEHVIALALVVRITLLKEMYCTFMQTINYPEFYNKNYKTCKLKDKLVKDFKSRINFWQRYSGTSELVYSVEILTGQAVGVAFENATSEERLVIEAAMVIRRVVRDGCNESQKLPWPPTDKDLRTETLQIPQLLTTFLSFLYSKNGKPQSTRCHRRVVSTGHDICYNVTKGEWKMPKHIMIGMWVRHLTGNTQLINILNRHGHSVSHSFLLEMETAMCDSVQVSSGSLPPSIIPDNNLITHFCWDNFDLNEETISGAGTTHSTHGIVIQEIKEQPYIPQPTPEVDRTKKRSIHIPQKQLDPCFINSKVEPTLITNRVSLHKKVDFKIDFSNFMWTLSRREMNKDGQSVPGWNGWVSNELNTAETICSTVDYMEHLSQPITEHSTVQEVLKISQEASRAVGQKYTFITFDLAVAKMAYSIVWQNKVLYKNVIIHLGVFHILCAYLKAIGKMMHGSGFEEVVIDSKICASGSIEKVMKGKHYNRSLRVHKAVMEALERLSFNAFLQHGQHDLLVEKAKEELKNVSNSNNDINDEHMSSLKELAESYFQFKQGVRHGKLGKTAQFWMLYMDAVWKVLNCLTATKRNDFDLHITCLEQMCPLFFSMDHPNYSRYLTAYIILLLNLKDSHPGAEELLRCKGFSVRRSNVSGSRNAVDLTIEQTINRQAKCKGGIVGFSQNVAAYHKWCMTRHKRASIVTALLEESGLDSKDQEHKDCHQSQMRLSEKRVQSVKQSFESFINPFDTAGNDRLISLSSGMEATEKVEAVFCPLKKMENSCMKILSRQPSLNKLRVSMHLSKETRN